MDQQITAIHKKEFTRQNEECAVGFNTEKLETKSQLNNTSRYLTCVHCDFKYTDHEALETHLGSIHPEFSDLTNIVIYQKSAKLFHCQLCFFTNKVYSNVYNHVATQHPKLSKNEEASQTTELHEGIASDTSKQLRATKRKLKESKVIEEEKSIKRGRRGRRKRTETASSTIEIQPIKHAETSSSTIEVQPIKRKPGRPKRKVEETKSKSVDFNCEKCGTRFHTLDELNSHNCQKKKQKDANAPLFEFEYCDYSGHYPIQYESTRKPTVSNNPKELAVSNNPEEQTVSNNPEEQTVSNNPKELTDSNNPKKQTVSNDPEESSEEKNYAKSLQENVKYVRGTFYCNSCKFHCKSKSSALYHVVRVHNKPYPYQCGECGRCFVMDKELKRHMSVHTGEAYYKCSKCDFESDYARAFKNHEKQCTSQQREDNYSENIGVNKQQNADKERKLISSLQPHSSRKEEGQLHGNSFAKIESSEAGKKYLQLNAGKIQASKLQLLEPAEECGVAHQEDSASSKDNILSCHECGKIFEEQDKYQKHKLLHVLQKPLTCEFTHDDVATLNDGMEKNHTERKTISCDFCNAKYESEEDLQHHLNIHKPNAEVKTFNCEICSTRFDKKIDLHDHLKTHKQNISKANQSNVTDNRTLYKCHYCSYSTCLFVNYMGHVRIAHTKDFPIHCSFCGDGFQLPAELKKHKCQQNQDGNVISSQGDE